jgi:anti-sigma factor ChrR (cupin superfamily)
MAGNVSGAPSQIIVISDHQWRTLSPAAISSDGRFWESRVKSLWSDPATKRRAQLARFEPGAVLPMHRHSGDELLYVVEGAISDESGTVTSGNMAYRPNGCVHSVTSRNGATVFAIIGGAVEPATDIGDAPRSQIFILSDIAWVDVMPGVQQKPVWQDKETRRRAALVRFEPGAKLPRHRHLGDELIFVIEGSNADESGEVTAGNMNYRPNRCVHTVTTRNGATVLALVSGGVEMVE